MISWVRLGKTTEKFVADNSPIILTAMGVAGTLASAYLTGKASFKAYEIIDEEHDRRYRETPHGEPFTFTKTEKAKLVWKEYLPPAGTLLTTVACIICANRISTRRAAAMAAAYSISDKAFKEYKEKVLEKFGATKEQQTRDAILQDRMDNDPPCNSDVVIVGSGDVLCYDAYSGRYFQSNMEAIKKAQNDTNYEILHNNYCSLGDFYNRLGLSGTKFSEEIGWNSNHLLEIQFTTTIADDGKPVLCLDYHTAPVRNFDMFG